MITMYKINKINSSNVTDFAAEELKKYLRMMMPEGGDIKISYAPAATDGFRLGLMSDFGLDTDDAEDLFLDDILYIDCDLKGGIIAGSNERSILLSVYEYLRQNGCRWLFPGSDGEYIPMQDIVPVKYRHKPSCRYRGLCNEGAEFEECMLETINFLPKIGMNAYMLEFRIPRAYYDRYYNHPQNPTLSPEPLSEKQIIQWKRQCESEIAKCGLQFHDIGHGWTVEPFGIAADRGWGILEDDKISEESRKHLALVGGERKLWGGAPMNTSFCMSGSESRRLFVKYIADYAESHSNSDFLHVWLSDGNNNHCECDECKKKRPSDYYLAAMNELDTELSARGLSTRIVFIVYFDTTWPPVFEKINNPNRFSMLLAPITRSYFFTTDENYIPSTLPYERNKLKYPKSLDEYFAYFEEWKKIWNGSVFSYEYHFWVHQYSNPVGISFSDRISEDIKEYKKRGVNGLIEDGSQRSFFPTSLPFYTYARTLYDNALTPEDIANEYFAASFGDAAEEFKKYLEELDCLIDGKYFVGSLSSKREISRYFNPEYAECLEASAPILLEKGKALVKKYYNFDERVRTVSVRLIEKFIIFIDFFVKASICKARGNDKEAKNIFLTFREEFGRMEYEIRRYFDNFLFFREAEKVFFSDISKDLGSAEQTQL